MATDLFSKYYNNPTKSYIYTNLTCNGASADEMSFDIVDTNGVISDNENILASLGLEGIHVPLKQYTTDMRIIGPYEILYVRGINYGASYMSKSYKLCNDNPIYEDWMYESGITFAIRCTDGKSLKRTYLIKACGDLNDEVTFIDACQKQLDKFKLPINVSYDNMEITFTSTQLGYEFWIAHIILWQKTVDPSTGIYIVPDSLDDIINDIFKKTIENTHFSFGFTDEYIAEHGFIEDSAFDTVNTYMEMISNTNYEHRYHMITILNGFNEEITQLGNRPYIVTYFMYEDFSKYVPAYKYKNGAMKGCLVVPTYPIYNAENIYDYQKALRIVHIQDRVEDYLTPLEYDYFNIPLYVRVIRDVVDSFSTKAEYDTYCKWCKNFKPWIMSDEIPGPDHVCPNCNENEWNHESIPMNRLMTSVYKDSMVNDYMGLYGYCNYATKHNLWMTFGAFYARTTVDDDESTDSRNLIPSFIIYNPNDFPVTVKYMTFA
jgi:hypothetical protein